MIENVFDQNGVTKCGCGATWNWSLFVCFRNFLDQVNFFRKIFQHVVRHRSHHHFRFEISFVHFFGTFAQCARCEFVFHTFIFYKIKLFFINSSLLFPEIIKQLSWRVWSGNKSNDLLSCCVVDEIFSDGVINPTKNNWQKNWQRCLTNFCFDRQPCHNLRDQPAGNTQKNAFHDFIFYKLKQICFDHQPQNCGQNARDHNSNDFWLIWLQVVQCFLLLFKFFV